MPLYPNLSSIHRPVPTQIHQDRHRVPLRIRHLEVPIVGQNLGAFSNPFLAVLGILTRGTTRVAIQVTVGHGPADQTPNPTDGPQVLHPILKTIYLAAGTMILINQKLHRNFILSFVFIDTVPVDIICITDFTT